MDSTLRRYFNRAVMPRLAGSEEYADILFSRMVKAQALTDDGDQIVVDDAVIDTLLSEWEEGEDEPRVREAQIEYPCDSCMYHGPYCEWPDVDPSVAENDDCPILGVIDASAEDLSEDEVLADLRTAYLREFGEAKAQVEVETPYDPTGWMLDPGLSVVEPDPQVDVEVEAQRAVDGMDLDELGDSQASISRAAAIANSLIYNNYDRKSTTVKELTTAIESRRRIRLQEIYGYDRKTDVPDESMFY